MVYAVHIDVVRDLCRGCCVELVALGWGLKAPEWYGHPWFSASLSDGCPVQAAERRAAQCYPVLYDAALLSPRALADTYGRAGRAAKGCKTGNPTSTQLRTARGNDEHVQPHKTGSVLPFRKSCCQRCPARA